jgi:hypothetical protein
MKHAQLLRRHWVLKCHACHWIMRWSSRRHLKRCCIAVWQAVTESTQGGDVTKLVWSVLLLPCSTHSH